MEIIQYALFDVNMCIMPLARSSARDPRSHGIQECYKTRLKLNILHFVTNSGSALERFRTVKLDILESYKKYKINSFSYLLSKTRV